MYYQSKNEIAKLSFNRIINLFPAKLKYDKTVGGLNISCEN